jgi:hypothetical protein
MATIKDLLDAARHDVSAPDGEVIVTQQHLRRSALVRGWTFMKAGATTLERTHDAMFDRLLVRWGDYLRCATNRRSLG